MIASHRAALLVAMLFACGTDAPPKPPLNDASPSPRARVATFNVHRFFDPVCDSGNCEPGAYEEQPTASQFDGDAARIANGVRLLDADVVMLEEIESQTCLDALVARLGDTMPYAVLGETGAPASVDVAVLSRAPIDAVIRHRDRILTRPDGTTTTFAREFLEVHLTLHPNGANVPVIAFAAHFRSKVDDDPGRRLAEARAAHDIVVASARANPSALVVLGGDLNDEPGSAPIDALESDGLLLRVASDRALFDQGTYPYGSTWQAIDHLFQAREGAGAYVKGSATSVRGNPGYAGSDHAALVADFLVP